MVLRWQCRFVYHSQHCLHSSPALCTLHVDSEKSVGSGSWSAGFTSFNFGKTVSLVSLWHLNSWDHVVLPQSPKELNPQAWTNMLG